MSVEQIIEYNFAPIMALIFQLMILVTSKSLSKKNKSIFIILFSLEVILILSYNLEYYCSTLTYPTIWRVFLSITGYVTRPALIYPFILLIRENSIKKDKLNRFDIIPLAFLFIIEQFAYFTKWVFYYDENNNFKAGPLLYIAYIVLIIYVFEFVYLVLRSKKYRNDFNTILVIFAILFMISAALIETYSNVKGMGIVALVYSTIFFMFALQNNSLNDLIKKETKLSQIDGLSQLYNRRTGEENISLLLQNHTPGMFALFDIDEFKHINDTYGHVIGDEAIIKVAEVLKDDLLSNCVIFRLGGDEFGVYSPNVHCIEDAEEVIDKIFEDISSIMLSSDYNYHINISLGLTVYDGNSDITFDQLYKETDKKLYVAKTYKGNYYIN